MSRRNFAKSIGGLAAFMNQYVSAPVCTPSRFSCLTDKYSSRSNAPNFLKDTKRHGQSVVQWNSEIMGSDVTLPGLLKDGGHKTGFAGKSHVVHVEEWEQLEYADDPRDPEIAATLIRNKNRVQTAIKDIGFEYAESIYHRNPERIGCEELSVHNMDWITKGGVDFIEQQSKDDPFFLYFATTLPHWPDTPERSWNGNPLATADGFLTEAPNAQPA